MVPNQITDNHWSGFANEIADSAITETLQRTRPAKQVTAVSDLTDEIRKNLALIDRMTATDSQLAKNRGSFVGFNLMRSASNVTILP